MALALSTRPPAEHLAALNALREQAGVHEATLFSERGRVLAFSGDERVGLMPEPPGAAVLRQLRAQHELQRDRGDSRQGPLPARAGAGHRREPGRRAARAAVAAAGARRSSRRTPRRCSRATASTRS